jgi:hypothetical protein
MKLRARGTVVNYTPVIRLRLHQRANHRIVTEVNLQLRDTPFSTFRVDITERVDISKLRYRVDRDFRIGFGRLGEASTPDHRFTIRA